MWGLTAADIVPIAGAILYLIVLEGLLSADNALVLALMVRHLPEGQQKRALRYGIFGAFLFRFIAVIFATILLQYWWLKVVGGCYLLYIAMSHLIQGEDEGGEEQVRRFGRGFWATVVSVEIADVAFSIDSILAAVSTAEALPEHLEALKLRGVVPLKLVVIYIGGVLGIITMRLVAGWFLRLLKKFRGLAIGAYVMVAWIGVHLIGGGLEMGLHPALEGRPRPTWHAKVPDWAFSLPLEMPDWLFWTGMGLILGLSFLIRPKGKAGTHPESAA